MTRLRRSVPLLVFVIAAVFPSVLRAATTELRVLFDVDDAVASGCTVSGMQGVDQVLVTRVESDGTTARVVEVHRQVCTGGALGAPVDVDTTGWPAVLDPASGMLSVETRIPFAALVPSGTPIGMHLGFEASQPGGTHTALTHPNGDPILFPTVRGGRRRAVGSTQELRTFTLDGQTNDWGQIPPLVQGIASGGSQAVRIIKVSAFANTADDFVYFAFVVNISADAPFANDDLYTRPLGSGLTVPAPGVLANDGHPAGAPLTAVPVRPADHGEVTLNPDGSFTYSPTNPASSQTDTFEYKATDGTKDSNVARVTIEVASETNTPPTAVDDAYTTDEDVPLNVAAPGVLANDSDADGDALTATLLTGPAAGTVVLAADGGFTYTPPANFFGTTTFTYSVSDGTASATASVTITVSPINDPPVVTPATFSVPENSTAGTVVGTVSASDVEGDSLTFAIVGGNTSGAFAIDAGTGQITVANAAALDFETAPQFSLIVRVSDATDSDETTITINVTDVNETPIAVADATTIAEDTSASIAAPGLLANDSDPDGDALTASKLTDPSNGVATVSADGAWTYTPNANFNGTDSFTYQVSDGALSATGTVTITVTAVNDAPSFTSGGDVTVNEDTPHNAPWATAISAGPPDEAGQTLTFNATNDDNTLFAVQPSISPTGVLTFTPAPDAHGAATVTVTLSDSGSNVAPNVNTSGAETFTITVTPVNDAPSFTKGADVVVVDTDGAQTVANWATALSAGPANEAAQTLEFIVGNDSPALFSVAPAIAPNGTLTFTPAPGQDGVATVTVQIRDDGGVANGGVDTSAAQTFTITIEKVPAITSASATTFVVGQGGTFTVTTTGRPRPDIAQTGTLPAGVTFVDGSGATQGTGVLSGTPAALTGGIYPITFQATNVRGSSPVQNFTLTVNEAPAITSPATATFTRGSAGTFTVTTSGFPQPALSLTGTLPAGLSFTDNADGTATISGTPTAAGGSYSPFTLTASNGVGANAAQNFTIIINEAPAITSANSTGFSAGVPSSFTVTTTGFPAPALTSSGTLPVGITFTDNGDGTATLGGTAANGSGGVYGITVTATNVAGSAPQSFTITVCNEIVVTNPANATGPAGSAFSETFTQTGAVGSATFTLATGTLPAGLTLAADGTLSGTPTQNGTFPITVLVTDANNCTGVGATYTLVITCPTITVTNPANATGTASSAFSETFTQSGGIGTATFSIASGTLPAGLTLSSAGVLSGTPTETGSFPITVTATDSNGCTGTGATYTLVIGCQTITVTNPANANGTASSAFSETFTQSGGIGTTTFSVASGTLPAGLTLSSAGVLSGTPTETGSFPITVTATDANGCTGTSGTYTLVIGCQTITVTNPANASGTAGSAFSETFTQTDGIGTTTFTLASGTLPAGLTLASNGVLSGTPTQTGSFPITVTATDANGCTGTSGTYTLVIGCQTITVTNPANATGPAGSPFSETFTQSGAIGSATFTLASGTLPAGLTLATNGVLSGTPSQGGSFPITVTVTDANGCTGTSSTYTLVITCPIITVTNPANANGTANSAFSETFTQSGGQGTITYTLASGTLPTGLTLATNGTLSGTPTQTGSFPITVTATDANGCTGTGSTYTIVIGCQTITVTNPANANGTAGSAFSETFTQTGGIGTATFTLASGTLPAGLTLAANGTLSGTPTQAGSFPITVMATDSNGCSGTGSTYTIVIGCQTITVTNPSNAGGTINVAFGETFTQSGAIGSATFTTSSTLPNGLSLSAAGVLSGTPTETGTFPIVVTVTDANGCTGTSATYNLVIACQTITVTDPANANGTVGTPFSETFTQTGANGTATFTTSSTLPAGITLSAAGVLSGTPTQAGNFPITVTVTDSNGCTGSSSTYTLVIACQTITVTNPGNTTGTVDAAFTATFTQSGAIGTATFTTSSTLPSGLSLSAAGVLSGTPGEPGSFPIVVTVTDDNGCTGTSSTYTLVIACQTITVTNPANAGGTVDAAFSETFTQTGVGTHTPVTWSVSGTLPSGLTLNTSTGVLSGTPGAPGTFPITVTATDVNGCSGTGVTYDLVIACQTITVTNPGVTAATYNVPFSQTFTQTGVGTHTPAVWSIASGTLPTGITLNSSTGVLSGTPTQTGTFPITVTVTDANSCSGTGATYTLSVAPVAVNDSYSNAVNNTQVVLTGGTTATPSTPSVQIAGTIVTNDQPSGAVTVVPGTSATSNGGSVTVAADGTFLYTPPVNPTVAAIASDTFTYTVSSNTGGTAAVTSAPATVTINLSNRVWYVKNDSAAGGNGQSQAPFDTLAEAQAASTANDYVFVFAGSGNTTGQNSGFVMKSDQKLYGQGVALVVNGHSLVAAGAQPQIGNAAGDGVNITNVSADVRGLNIGGAANAIDVTTTAGGTVTIANNTIRSAVTEGIDVNVAGGTLAISISDVSIASTGSHGIDLTRTAGALNVTLTNLNVAGTVNGAGIMGTGLMAVTGGGTWTIGSSIDRVGGAGVSLGNGASVSGVISLADLDVYSTGAALHVIGNGTGTTSISVTNNVATLDASGGPAADLSNLTATLALASLQSAGSTTRGVSLTNVNGTFSAPTGSAISNATTQNFFISGGTANVTYGGTINDTTGRAVEIASSTGGTKTFSGAITNSGATATGISLTTNTGTTIRFSGGMTLSTAGNPAFTATGGGTVEVCDENPCVGGVTGGLVNTLTTTTGTALTVSATTIGTSGLEFRSISSNGAPNGIFLQNTGSTGGLRVTGNSVGNCGGSKSISPDAADCTGGTIQSINGGDGTTAGIGIYLDNTRHVSLTRMRIMNCQNFAIRMNNVVKFTGTNLYMTGTNGNNAAFDEGNVSITEMTGTTAANTNSSLTFSTLEGSAEYGLKFVNTAGVLDRLTLDNVRISQPAGGDDAVNFRTQGTATANLTISNSLINAAPGDLINTSASGTSASDINLSSNTLTNTLSFAQILGGGGGSTILIDDSADVTYTVSNNVMTGARGDALLVRKSVGAAGQDATATGTISGNTIGNGTVNSGSSEASGIELNLLGSGYHRARVTGNTIRNYSNFGLYIEALDSGNADNGALDVKADANDISLPNAPGGGLAQHGIYVNGGTSSTAPGDNYSICADIGHASLTASKNAVTGASALGGFDVRVRQRFNTSIRLPGLSPSGAVGVVDTATGNFLIAQNNRGGTPTAQATAATIAFAGGASCNTP